MNAKVANSIFTSVAYHDRMITMFGPLNYFSIEAEFSNRWSGSKVDLNW